MYIIYFDLVAIFLYTTIFLLHCIYYEGSDRSGRMFRVFLLCSLIETILDSVTALNIDGKLLFPDYLSTWLLVFFYVFEHAASCIGAQMVALRMKNTQKALNYCFVVLLAIGWIAFIVNGFTGFAFKYINGVYTSSIFSFVFSNISIPYFFIIFYILIRQRNEATVDDKRGPFALVIAIFISLTIQRIIPGLLLACFGKAVASVIYCTYYNTPEHLVLLNTIEALKKSQEQERLVMEEVEEANRHKTEFLVNMSHRLRTPINSILGFNEILIREDVAGSVKSSTDKLLEAGERLLDLVNMVEDFSQLETGLVELRPTEYNVGDAYVVIYNRLHRILGESFSIDNVIDPSLPKRLYGDAKKLCQILEVILSYIVKKSDKGEIVLYIDNKGINKRVVELEMTVVFENNKTSILGDNLTEDIDYIFINRLMEAMGRKINIFYDEDRGNVFNLTFIQEIVDMMPLGDVKADKNGNLVEESVLNNKFIMSKARILAVDDTPLNLKVLEGMLMSYKVKLTMAESGAKAIDIMKNEEFDLIFMDILMPELSGEETLEIIRSMPGKNRNTPVVALTANVFIGARDMYLAEGFAEYIMKPINGKTIEDTLRTLLPDFIEEDWANIDITEEVKKEGKKDRYSNFLGGTTKKAYQTGRETTLNKSETGREKSRYVSFLGKPDAASGEKNEKPVADYSVKEEVPGLNISKGLGLCGGNMALYREIFDAYCQSPVSDRLISFYEKGDWDNYRILIHGVKSTSISVGLDLIAEAAYKLEEAARAKDIDYIISNHSKWLEDYEKVIGAMKTMTWNGV